MGLCMLSRARCAVHGKQFVCAEFGIRAESVRSGVKSPHQECNMMKRGFISLSLRLLLLLSLLFTKLMVIVQHYQRHRIYCEAPCVPKIMNLLISVGLISYDLPINLLVYYKVLLCVQKPAQVYFDLMNSVASQ